MADRTHAYELATYYLLTRKPGSANSDNYSEVYSLVDAIIDAAKAEINEERGTIDREAVARANGMTYP